MPQTQTLTEVSLTGTVVGAIWMPCAECTKDVRLSENDFRYSDNSRPTLRDFALLATNDGDFRGCNLTADSAFVFKRTRKTATGTVTRKRTIPVTAFRSLSDCVDKREAWEVLTDDGDDEA